MKIIEDFLTPNKYSRPQRKLKKVNAIIIHYVGNPLTTAKNNRDFFENRKYGNTNFGSAHYIIDLHGDVIQCIPDNEMAYHVGAKKYKQEAIKRISSYPNNSSIGIECTHLDWNGKMTVETYNSLLDLCVNKFKEYNLTSNDLWLHYDITGKLCHKWFVNNPKEWIIFKQKVDDLMDDKQEDWRVDLGRQSVKKLAEKGFIDSPEYWYSKMLESADNWQVFTLFERILERMDK